MKINSKKKGSNGEREFCEFLFHEFQLEVKPERNLEQVRHGGCDIICAPFAFEIKRCETIKHYDWWAQVKEAVNSDGPAKGLIPVVAYRQNKKDWNFLISASHINVDFGFIHIENVVVFKHWVKNQINMYKNKINVLSDVNVCKLENSIVHGMLL